MSTTKERPILFSGPMVRAILDGRKTQTRRIGKIQSDTYTELGVDSIGHQTKGRVLQATYRAYPGRGTARWAICEFPYGLVGDRLWVRETWGTNPCYDYLPPSKLTCHSFIGEHQEFKATATNETHVTKWRPSIFMPRWASRITLEIVSVRVERLQDISEEDCISEGIKKDGPHDYGWKHYIDPSLVCSTPCQSYSSLWDSINGKGSWAKNPWVWMIEFRMSKP